MAERYPAAVPSATEHHRQYPVSERCVQSVFIVELNRHGHVKTVFAGRRTGGKLLGCGGYQVPPQQKLLPLGYTPIGPNPALSDVGPRRGGLPRLKNPGALSEMQPAHCTTHLAPLLAAPPSAFFSFHSDVCAYASALFTSLKATQLSLGLELFPRSLTARSTPPRS